MNDTVIPMPASQSTPVEPGQRLVSLTLEMRQWELVFQMLNEAPVAHRISGPIIQAVAQQLIRHQQGGS
jgi:hypothetical protein